jgi:hypothetical protein
MLYETAEIASIDPLYPPILGDFLNPGGNPQIPGRKYPALFFIGLCIVPSPESELSLSDPTTQFKCVCESGCMIHDLSLFIHAGDEKLSAIIDTDRLKEVFDR